jgi:uncharacterized protein YbjT (DUF2867 family)
VRNPARAPQLENAVVVQAGYADAELSRRALDGAHTLFMVAAEESTDRVDVHRTFIDAAVAAGVEHVVYVSFATADPQATFTLARDHWATEQHIKGSGLRWTFLRANIYADFLALMIGDDDVIRGPAGEGRAAFVALDDLADAAVAILGDPAPHAGQGYLMTGPEALSFTDVADVLTAATGRSVTYHAESVEEAYASRASYGAPDWQVDAWVTTYTAIAAGELAEVTGHVELLTGHPARSRADLLQRQRSGH